jgi:hypothetical protein
MRTLRFVTTGILLMVSLAFCASDPEAGSSCMSDDECGDVLKCYCKIETVPGVCSKTCTTDADCASAGEGLTCSLDFCTGVNVCLRQ